jgi:hypothetical protein
LKSSFQYIENRISPFLLWLYTEFDCIEVCFALSPLRDFDKLSSLKLFDELIHPPDAHTDVLSQPCLAGEAFVVVPGVAEEHGINYWLSRNSRG